MTENKIIQGLREAVDDAIDELRWQIAAGPDGCASEKQESCELGDPHCDCLVKARAQITETTVH